MRARLLMKIGKLNLKNKLLMAPMAGVTDAPFRALVREFGCALAFTEMISSDGLVHCTEMSHRYLRRLGSEYPFAVQIFGSDARILSEAAKIVADAGASVVNINMGCPAKKVFKTGAGAALMRDPRKAGLVLRKVRAAVSVPLTIKMRSGWREQMNALQIAVLAEEEGIDAIIVHPRTVEQGFSGSADWRVIKEVKEVLKIPVIGNGDVRAAGDAARMLHSTGCDAVMIGRGAVGNPWIFRDIQSLMASGAVPLPPGPAERRRVLRKAPGKISRVACGTFRIENSLGSACLGIRKG